MIALMDIQPHEGLVSTDDIHRACNLYAAGGSSDHLRDAFPNASPEALHLLWSAAVAAFNTDYLMFGDY